MRYEIGFYSLFLGCWGSGVAGLGIGLSVAGGRWLWFSCGVAYSGGGLVSIFREFSSSIGGAFILAGALGTGLSFYGIWTVS